MAAVADVFGWIGSSRRKQVVDLVNADVQAWVSAWSGSLSAVVVEELADNDPLPGSMLLLGDVAIGTSLSLAELGAGLVDITDTTNPLAEHLGSHALADLLARLVGKHVGAGEPVATTTLSRALHEARLGAVRVAIRLPHGAIVALLARSQVDRRVPVVARAATPVLVRRASAIESLSTSLKVELDLGEVSLGDARALSPGDVLVTQVPLTRWADIVVGADALPQLRGRLGSAEGRRAVAIEINANQESEL